MNEPVILIVGPMGWRIGVAQAAEAAGGRIVDVPLADTVDAMAAAAAKALKELGYQGHPLVLALPPNWCLSAPISTADLPRPRNARHQAMIYRLEEQLPLAAEEFVADFVSTTSMASITTENQALTVAPPGGHEPPQRLGIAVATQNVLPIVTALEAQGVAIGPICPESLLALQRYSKSNKLNPNTLLLWDKGSNIDAFGIASGLLASWNVLESNIAALSEYLSIARLQKKTPSACVLLNRSETLQAPAEPPVEMKVSKSVPEAATETAGEILGGSLTPLVDLRRDGLAARDPYRMVRRSLRAAMVSAFVLTVCLVGAFLVQAQRYDQSTAVLEDQQQAIFRRLYPGSAVPMGVRARLQSETLRLRAMNGQSGDLPSQGSALVTLYEVLRRLPSDVRFRMLDLRFGPDDFSIEGQTKSHTDADVLATSLRRQKGFQVEPTRTEQLSTGQVAFTISGIFPRTELKGQAP